MKHGIIIGYSNSGRKTLFTSCKVEKLKEKLMVRRIKGFIDTKEDVQKGLLELINQIPSSHFIFITIQYQRLDIMKMKLNLLMNHFKPYSEQLYLIVTSFEKSEDLDDIIEIKTRLADPWDIRNVYAHKYENKCGYIIDCNKIQKNGFKFFQQLAQSNQNEIKFDSILMNLVVQYDEKILEMLQTLINNKGNQIKQVQRDNFDGKLIETRQNQKELQTNQHLTTQIKNQNMIRYNRSPQINFIQKKEYQQNLRQSQQLINSLLKKQKFDKSLKSPLIKINQNDAIQDQQKQKIQQNSIQLKSQEPLKPQKKNFLQINIKNIAKMSEENRQKKQLLKTKI